MITRRQSELAAAYRRNGVLRLPDQERRARKGPSYHKGYEIRLVAFSRKELQRVRRLLREEGYPVSRAFAKVHRLVQPLYGKEVVERFLGMVEAAEAAHR
jgi:hypothetical protein